VHFEERIRSHFIALQGAVAYKLAALMFYNRYSGFYKKFSVPGGVLVTGAESGVEPGSGWLAAAVDEVGEVGNGVGPRDAEAGAEIVPEGDAELTAGLGEAEEGVAAVPSDVALRRNPCAVTAPHSAPSEAMRTGSGVTFWTPMPSWSR